MQKYPRSGSDTFIARHPERKCSPEPAWCRTLGNRAPTRVGLEQAAFSPANVVPGIRFSPDKMLQGRLFS